MKMTISESEFSQEAAAAGFPMQAMTVYRLDGRSPEMIRQAGGLFPNPGKPPLSMKEHVAPGCPGGSRYVSTSVVAGNMYNIRNAGFIVSHKARGPSDAEALAWVNGEASRVQATMYRTYEYEICNVLAALVTTGGVAGEQEALIACVPVGSLTRYRSVFLRQPGVFIDGYPSFVSLKDGQVRLSSWYGV